MKLWRCYRALCRLGMDSKCLSKSVLPALIGLCLGVTVSIMYAPFSDDSCETYVARQDPQKMVKLRDPRSLDRDDNDGDLYEPRQIDPAYKLDSKTNSKLFRPKFAATELGIRQKLFVGVLSSKSTLNTLAVALNKTLGGYVTKIMFFVDERTSVIPPGMMIINFNDGDSQRMPINVFNYIGNKTRYGHEYDYYMLLTDKAYVRGSQVFDLVSQISVSKHVYMGVAAGNVDGKPYCSLDGAVILSQSLISSVNASLMWCYQNCHHSYQSLNFGKCLGHATDLYCKGNAGETKEFNSFHVSDLDFNVDIDSLRENLHFNLSDVVFPVPDDTTHYKLHRYFCEVELSSSNQEIENMKEKIAYMSKFAPGGKTSVTWPIGVNEPYKPKNRFDVIRWDYFTETHIFFQDEFTNVRELVGVDKLDVQDVIKVSMEKLNKKYEDKFSYLYLVNGYRRFDPQRGMEYILDLALEDVEAQRKTGATDHILQKRVFLVKALGEVEIVPMPYVSETTRVNLVLPVTLSDGDAWEPFLEGYSKLQTEAGESLGLVVLLIYPQSPPHNQEDAFVNLRTMIQHYNDKHEGTFKTTILTYVNNSSYLSEFQLMDVVSYSMPDDSLLFVCSVGMEVNLEMLNRVRINTIPGWQVYFPIGFWQFKPNLIYDKLPFPSEIEFNSRAGHYDILSYEHGSFYNSDYKQARRVLGESELFNFDVYEMFVSFGNIHVLRGVEPEFKHRYQDLKCQIKGPEKLLKRCQERKALGLGTRAQLAKRIFEYQGKNGHSIQNNLPAH